MYPPGDSFYLSNARETLASDLCQLAAHFHAALVPPDATAFGTRQKQCMLQIVPAWEASSKAEGERHMKWASDLSSSLALREDMPTASVRTIKSRSARHMEITHFA